MASPKIVSGVRTLYTGLHGLRRHGRTAFTGPGFVSGGRYPYAGFCRLRRRGVAIPAVLWLAVIGIGLIGCGGRAPDSLSGVAPTRQPESQSVAGAAHDEILWYVGDIDSAFAAARAARKPVLLYWGADWCPPCSRLKATVFRHPEFVQRTRLFVAVDLDGDKPGAQRLGEAFDVYGYPTVVVLSPERDEITRIATKTETAPYVRALDAALAASQPAAAAYAAVLGGVATDSDLRLLGYYSWGQDNERLVPESQLPATRIEDTAIALFREASAAKDAFFLRTTRYMHRLETYPPGVGCRRHPRTERGAHSAPKCWPSATAWPMTVPPRHLPDVPRRANVRAIDLTAAAAISYSARRGTYARHDY